MSSSSSSSSNIGNDKVLTSPPPWRPDGGHSGIFPASADDDDDDADASFLARTAASGAPLSSFLGSAAKICLTITIGLYIANQKHLLPKPLSAVVSKVLFWPTLPITAGKRWWLATLSSSSLRRNKSKAISDDDNNNAASLQGDGWMTQIDDTVILGGAPFGWLGIPDTLARQHNVHGVINFCAEYQGPTASYQRLGIQELRLPTVDHFEPSLEHLQAAVRFVAAHEAQNQRVYVHCRAGHGRSAAAAVCWLLSKEQQKEGNKDKMDPQTLNEQLCQLRNVRKGLWKQPNIRRFYADLLAQQEEEVDDDDNDSDDNKIKGVMDKKKD